MIADVAHVRSSEECITDGMYKHIGITVAEKSAAIIKADASEPQLSASHHLMDVISKAYSYLHILYNK